MAEDFATEDFCTVVFDEFFFTNINRENVMRHVIKLVWYIHPKLPPARLDTLQKALQPGPHQVQHTFRCLSSSHFPFSNTTAPSTFFSLLLFMDLC